MAKKFSRSTAAIACSIVIVALTSTSSMAQFLPPFASQLPDGDFTWYWGDIEDMAGSERPDIDIEASDLKWRCHLLGDFSVRARFDRERLRDIEEDLKTALNFIENTYYTMGNFEFDRFIDWGRLDCKVREISVDEQELQEREDRARERAERRRERRRDRDDD